MNCPGHRPAPSAIPRIQSRSASPLQRPLAVNHLLAWRLPARMGRDKDGRLTLHRKVAVYCRCQHRRARVSHRTGLPERPHACSGCGEDEKDTACRTRATTAPQGWPSARALVGEPSRRRYNHEALAWNRTRDLGGLMPCPKSKCVLARLSRAASGRHARRSPFICCARRIPARRVSPLFVNGLMKSRTNVEPKWWRRGSNPQSYPPPRVRRGACTTSCT